MKFFTVEPEDRSTVISRIDFSDLVETEDVSMNDKAKMIDETITAQAQYYVFKRDSIEATKEKLVENISFDAKYQPGNMDKTPYFEVAQMLSDVILSKKPEAIYAGMSTSAYMKLCTAWYPKSEIKPYGIFKEGFFGAKEKEGGVPVYKVPSSLLKQNFIWLDCLQSLGKIICIEVINLKDIYAER